MKQNHQAFLHTNRSSLARLGPKAPTPGLALAQAVAFDAQDHSVQWERQGMYIGGCHGDPDPQQRRRDSS
jgi:hypothetical protein